MSDVILTTDDDGDILKLAACPKCGLEAKTLLHPFCQHLDCPVLKALGRGPMGGILEPISNTPTGV